MWVIAAVLCVVLLAVLGVRHFVVTTYHVPSGSMAPTLNAGEYIVVDRTSRGTARRGDVVVFDGKGYFGGASQYWVKRVIGVGGDRVRCCTDEGQLEVNGRPLEEPYLPDSLTRASAVDFDVAVPEGHMFLLGDSRDHSSDSRNHLGDPGGGMVPVSRTQGRVTRVVWPLPDGREISH
ncbi:signal peptidase I [Dermabacter jinjuensis]|uniref:Signal peptidase I n=1 Tax=Dermabacter jinjuensis TaxID=1667168 RepID=A0ABN5DLU0_9MICO|nr:signal peptidase I [Dermabacter jinjuensis]